MQHRQEVVSEQDAIETCETNGWKLIKVYWGKRSNKGKLMMHFDDLGQVQQIVKQEQSKNYVVYCEKELNNYLYVSNKRSYTYLQTEAKILTREEAEKKAKAMSNNGVNKWKVLKVK